MRGVSDDVFVVVVSQPQKAAGNLFGGLASLGGCFAAVLDAEVDGGEEGVGDGGCDEAQDELPGGDSHVVVFFWCRLYIHVIV